MGEMITLKAADGHQFSAYHAGPRNAGRGLVVIQEIFGVNQHMRDVCDRFAADGYQVVAPALFDRAAPGIELGYTADDVAKGREARGKLTEAMIMADVVAAAGALTTAKKGIIGYCFGGTVAWWGACRTNLFSAASGWYGGGIAAARNEHPNCPVQLHFAEKDHSISMADVAAIRAAQPGVEVFDYPGAEHGFGCDARAAYNAGAYQLAHERTMGFFATNLTPAEAAQ